MEQIPKPLTDRILAWAVRQDLHPGWRLLLATAVVLAVGWARASFVTSLLPWLPFIPPVTLLTLVLGARCGIYSTVLAAVVAGLSIAPGHDPRNLMPEQWSASALFVLILAFMVVVAGELRASYRRNDALLQQAAADSELLRRGEAELELLNEELGHRLKNQLAVVQAITTQTIRRSESLHAAEQSVSERLSIFGRASDVLLRRDAGEHELGSLLETVIAPLQLPGDRVRASGGRVVLPSHAMLALAMSVHELATNAAKYGALSNDEGTVDISWECDAEPGGRIRLRFAWRECGGPAVTKPVRRGFGTTLLERALTPYFKGSISTDFRPYGLVFTIDAVVVE